MGDVARAFSLLFEYLANPMPNKEEMCVSSVPNSRISPEISKGSTENPNGMLQISTRL